MMRWFFLLCSVIVFSQKLTVVNQEQDSVSFRGLSVVNDSIFWVSGSKGIVGKTIDDGSTFEWFQPKNYTSMEFRDVHAFSAEKALFLGVTEPAVIIETQNGGKIFKTRYTDTHEKAFIDAIDCLEGSCIAIGDATFAEEFYWLQKEGKNWYKQESLFSVNEGEAYFAASGSNIKQLENNDFLVISGGTRSRLFYQYMGNTKVQEIPIIQGKETTGANGFDFLSKTQSGIIVGGDFMQPKKSMFNLVLFSWDKQEKHFEFTHPNQPPRGYKSSITYLTKDLVVCVGTSGIDYSKDGGKNWTHFSDESYHAVQKRNETSCILAGSNGKIAVLEF